MTTRYVVILWRRDGARFGAADQVNSYTYRRLSQAERNAAAWQEYDREAVATVVEVAP